MTADNPAFRGLSLLLAEHVPDPSSHSPLLDRVRQSRDTLTPAERRVADVVLGNPFRALLRARACIAAARPRRASEGGGGGGGGALQRGSGRRRQ